MQWPLQKHSIFKGFLLGSVVLSSLGAQERNCMQELDPCTPPLPEEACSSQIRSNVLDIRHIEGDGIGYKEGYSTAELFLSRMVEDHLIYLDGRGHIQNNGKWAANGGLGYRFRHDRSLRVYGVNAFFDHRKLNHIDFQQLGFGLETLGKYVNLRANGYIPFGKTKKTTNVYFDRFFQNHLLLKTDYKQAMWGIDGEIESEYFSYKDMDVGLAIGAYYFEGMASGKSAVGGKARATVKFYDSFYVKAHTSYDTLFDFNIQGEVGLSLSFFKAKKSKYARKDAQCRKPSLCSKDHIAQMKRMTKLPIRQELIVATKSHDQELAKNAFGIPYFFYHVDNTSTNSLGTVEHPFATLAEAEAASLNGETVYVHGGNGTSFGMSDGFTMKNDQKLLSAFVSHSLNSQDGGIEISQQSSIRPIITNNNLGGNGVILADGSEVTGFSVSGSSGSGFFGTGLTRGVKISDNLIIGNGSDAGSQAGITLLLDDGVVIGGTMEISNNEITSSNGGTDGIFIGPTVAPLNGPAGFSDIQINGNNISGNDSEGIRMDRAGTPTGEFVFAGRINNNSFSGNGSDAIEFSHASDFGTVNFDLIIENNTFNANADGLDFTRAAGSLVVQNNIFSNNSSNAMDIDVGDTPATAENLNIDILYNEFFDNGGSGMEVELDYGNATAGRVNCQLIGNTYRRGLSANDMTLDNNSGTTSYFKAKIVDNDGPIVLGNIDVVP